MAQLKAQPEPRWVYSQDQKLPSNRPLVFVCHRRSSALRNNGAKIKDAIDAVFPESVIDASALMPENIIANIRKKIAEVSANGGVIIIEATARHDIDITAIDAIETMIKSISSEIQEKVAFILIIDQENSEAWAKYGSNFKLDNPQGPRNLEGRAKNKNIITVFTKDENLQIDLEATLRQLAA